MKHTKSKKTVARRSAKQNRRTAGKLARNPKVTLQHRDRTVTLARLKAPAKSVTGEAIIVLRNLLEKKFRFAWTETATLSGTPTAKEQRKDAVTLGKSNETPYNVWAGVSHPVRRKIVRRLLAAPAEHREMKQMTHLAPGPLYHHIHHLQRAGLITVSQRNRYELTESGRWFGLGMMALEMLLLGKNKRERPAHIRRGSIKSKRLP